ncbi:PREDICTED: uncharacterized protein LOC109590539 isoform X2 [Amphimedon queenslandica]|uniref:Nucleoside phosphorylase domain-containing protein n=1 Tax=Amphimedon queenslandica TaxID=400682 RepID=A0AAN0JYK6_AMPQE|nr:PREDICTED: uncharacterized protein LOC109590539 isoform X2 [Amphimedon queenslandica]|eukprot:XP_019861994.1 PREDICTED: uncharacterized protein LOC109590539 isoform X2 [Amphimedon queenslandica]
MKCTLPGTKSPTNSGKEQHWSWFESSTEEKSVNDADGSPRNADSSDPVQTITDSNALSKTVSDDTTQDNTAPAPTIAKDGATSTVGAEEGQPSAQVNQPPTTGGGNNCTVSGSTQTSTNLFNSMNTVTVAGKEENVSDDVTKGIKFLLMTATDPELKEVLEYLKPLDGQNKVIKKLKEGGVDIYIGKYGKHPVVVVQSAPTKEDQGSLPAEAVTNKMMEIFKPRYIIAIGICFKLHQKVNLGDVIVSDCIMNLHNIRMEPDCINPRIKYPVQAGDTLVPLFRKADNFKKMKSSNKVNAEEVKVHCGPMVSVPALVDDPEFKEKIKKACPDALAGEMEGAGIFYAAIKAKHKVEAIVIKAVADLADGKKIEYKAWKPFACQAAAEYVLHHLDDDRTIDL